MLNFAFVFFSLILAITPLEAALHTDTHTYILSPKENLLLIIERQKDSQTVISVGKNSISMAIHRTKGYILCNSVPQVQVLNLENHTFEKPIIVGSDPRCMLIHNDFMYVVNHGPNTVSAIDLLTHEVIKTLSVGSCPKMMATHKDKGYVVNWGSETISVIDLLTNTVETHHRIREQQISLAIYQGKGYLRSNSRSETKITIIDLHSFERIKTLYFGTGSVQPKLLSFTLEDNQGYALCENKLFYINLKNQTIEDSFALGNGTLYLAIYNGVGYIARYTTQSINVVDLKTKERIADIPNPKNLTVDFCGNYLYLGVTRWKSIYNIGLILFDSPYPGILGPLQGNAKRAFRKYESALVTRDYKAARRYYNKALALGEPKAFAVAAHAFLHNKWGAHDTDSDHWWSQFLPFADKSYYEKLHTLSITETKTDDKCDI